MIRHLIFLILFSESLLSQSIYNAYAKVTAISGNSVLTISNVSQTNHTFVVGQDIIIMQMQGDVIGTNTTNASSFGNISSIGSVGLYESKTILSISPASGTPTSITVASTLFNSYNTSTNSAVQIISFRDLGASFTTSANITGAAWNGSIGGVIAIRTSSSITLNHRISADALGFRGGAVSANADETCTNTVYITNSNLKAEKGEGIQVDYNTNFQYGRGKIANGGGGGSANNTGGAGGGNYTAGGDGGIGWNCTAANSGYGLGGLSLSSYISGSRIFMGGGGGGGQANNGNGTAGGNGGGIILLKTNTLVTNNTCTTSLLISASGGTAVNAGNDGAGGGGAGGTIVMQVNTWSLNATCPLTVAANGGTGGTVNNGGTHGGGGGGGQGAVMYSSTPPASNFTTFTSNGSGGGNNNGGSSFASSGTGTNGAGVSSGTVTVLPVRLVSFYATPVAEGKLLIQWCTAIEENTSHYVVEKSADALAFFPLGKVSARGFSGSLKCYELTDAMMAEGVTYYRLRTVDRDGGQELSDPIAQVNDRKVEFSTSPNPVSATDNLIIRYNRHLPQQFELRDSYGRTILTVMADSGRDTLQLDLVSLGIHPGIYYLQSTGSAGAAKKVIVLE